MDTSEEYIKMCSAAQEIQMKWLLEKGDYFVTATTRNLDCFEYPPGEVSIHGLLHAQDDVWYAEKESGDIWLPRQDQLQAMVDSPHKKFELLNFFYWLEETSEPLVAGNRDYWEPIRDDDDISLEKVTICFLMAHNYHKIWNGQDWVVDKDKPPQPPKTA